MANQLVELLFKATGNLPTYLDSVSRSMRGMVRSEQAVKSSLKGLATDLARARDPSEALEKVITRLASTLKIGVSGFAIIAAFKIFKDTANTLADAIKSSSSAVDGFTKKVADTKNVTSLEAVKSLWSDTEKTVQEVNKAIEKIESNTLAKLIGSLTGATDILREQKRLTGEIAQNETLNRLQNILDYKKKFALATDEERQQLERSQKIEADKAEIAARLSGARREEAEKLIEQIYAAEALKTETDKERQNVEAITKEREKQTAAIDDQLKASSQNISVLKAQLAGGKEAAKKKQEEIDLQNKLNEVDVKYKDTDSAYREDLKKNIQEEFYLRKQIAEEEENSNKAKELSKNIDQKRKELAENIAKTQKEITDRIKEGERSSGSLLDRLERAAENTGDLRLAQNIRNQREAEQRRVDKELLSQIDKGQIKGLVAQEGRGKTRSDQELMGSALNVEGSIARIAAEGFKRQTEIASQIAKMTQELKNTMAKLTEVAIERLGVPILRSI